MVLKAFKMRIYPNQIQKIHLKQTFGCARFVWNQMLDMQTKRYLNNPKAPYLNNYAMNNLLPQLKREYPWLKEAESTALQSVNRDLNDAFKRLFKKQNQRPNFKSKRYSQSYTSKYVNNNILIVDEHHIKLPKLGIVAFRAGRIPVGKIKAVTVRKNVVGQYYIAVLAECASQTLTKTRKVVGGDLGLKALLNLSDGGKEPLVRYDKVLTNKLHVWERKAARRRRLAEKEIAWDHHDKAIAPRTLSNFKNYQKARIQVAKIKQKIANQRLDQIQKYTTQLVRQYDLIVLEKLNIKGLLKNHKLARVISNATWSKLVSTLAYKCEWYGKQFLQVNPAYTSQICSYCDNNNQRLGLSKSEWLAVREWDCPKCQAHLDRDTNAARNILASGLATL